jgi:hypothetical protein
MMSRIILLTFALMVSGLVVHAQDDEPVGWQIEERCLADPIAPPEDWSYPGVILMSGYAGIHGMRSEWETPHVVAFKRGDNRGNIEIIGGQLSPDGRWYAAPLGERFVEISNNVYWFARQLRLYHTTDDQKVIDIDLSDYIREFAQGRTLGAWSYWQVQWFDNDSLTFYGITFHIQGDTITAETSPVALASIFTDRIYAPDVTRQFGTVYVNGESMNALSEITFFDDEPASVVNLNGVNNVTWRRDSSGFVALVQNGNQRGLYYYDRDGELIDRIVELTDTRIIFPQRQDGENGSLWSPSGDYFALLSDGLYIVDWNNQIVIDACLSVTDTPAWSPDGTMLAFLMDARESNKIIVLDMKTWQAYHVGWQIDGGVIGWRAGD